MSCKTNKKKMDFGGLLQSISPLLGLIPGAGAIAAPVANMAGQFIQNKQTQANSTLPRQQNQNMYGFAMGGYLDPPKKKKEITYKGADLPEFTVISQKPKNSSIDPFTYRALLKLQNSGNKPIYDLWKGAGSPKIHTSLSSNRQYYDSNDGSINISEDDGGLLTNFLSELPHAIQNTYMYPGNNLQRKYDSDAKFYKVDSPNVHKQILYDSPNTLEHEAHSIIEPQVRKMYDNIKHNKKMFNNGGYLDPTGPNTQEVIGHNPSIKDGVELPHAIVDDGETISNTSQGKYVFSDRLTNPKTGRSFAQDDKRLAQSDSLAIKKPVDKEAQNTLKINQMARDTLAKLNDQVRMIAQVSKLKNGINGYNGPHPSSDKLYEKAWGGLYNGDPTKPAIPLADDPFAGMERAQYDSSVPPTLGQRTPSVAHVDTYAPIRPILPFASRAERNPNLQINPVLPASAGQLKDVPEDESPNWLKDNLGTVLQGVGFGAQALSLLKRPDKQTLYANNAPINMQQYDPAQALNRSQYNFNALRSGISNSVGDANRMSNMQQAYSNKTRNEADILNHYNEMNKQSQVNYEQRLGQRQSENNQNRYNVDQINDQNLAARNNALRGMFANLAGLGGEINNKKSNQQNVKWLLEAYPDIAQFFQEQSKTKKKD